MCLTAKQGPLTGLNGKDMLMETRIVITIIRWVTLNDHRMLMKVFSCVGEGTKRVRLQKMWADAVN